MGLDHVRQKRKHVTISMISDADSKVGGIQFVAPMAPCGTFIKLKHKTITTLTTNTCQSFTSLKGLSFGDCPNGDYSDELKYASEYLSQGENQTDFEEKFFQQIGDVANSNITNCVFKKDVLNTLEQLYPGRIKGTAFAFSGHSDNDSYGIIWDEEKRNPVEKLYDDCGQIGAKRYNSIGLTTLFSRTELDFFDDRIAKWLDQDKKNFFKTKETANGKEEFVYPKYSFVYLLQSLIQVILVDYEDKLSKIDEQKIYDNWNLFLNNLSDKSNEKSLFKEYKGDTDALYPKNFVEFCLNKFLDKTDLLEEIKKDANNYELYTKASMDLRNCLSVATHANQIAAITVDEKNLTYDDYFIGANNFLYVPLRKAYRGMNENLKSTLESLGGLLKYKQVKLDQTETENKTLNDNEMKDIFGYNIRKGKEDVKGEKGKVIEKKDFVKAVVPKCYNPNISRDDFKKLMEKIEEYNKINDHQFLHLDLEKISEYVGGGFYIGPDRAKELISNRKKFLEPLCNKLSQDNVDEKYKKTYRIIFTKLCELEQNTLCDFIFNCDDLEKYLVINFLPESVIQLMFPLDHRLQPKILCELDTQEIYKSQLIESVDVDVICDMLRNQDQRKKKANEILKLCSGQLPEHVLRRLDFSNNGGLDPSVRNSIIFSRIKDLQDEQIQQIDLGQLDVKCVDLLLSDDYLPKLAKQQLAYLFSNRKDLFESLTPKKILSLISNDAFIGALNEFSNKQDVLSLINFEKIINFVSKPHDKEEVVRFISQYISNLPNDKIISLLPSFFVKQQGAAAATEYEKNKGLIRNKMSEVEKKDVLYKNIFKLRNCDFKNKPWEQLIKIFTEINGVDEQKKLIRYLFMNYESYFVHLNALLGNISPESSDSLEVSTTKKLVIAILKSSTEENKFEGVKIINKVVSKINLEDVSDSSSILSSVVKIFVDDLDVSYLKKVRFSELQTDVLQKLLKKRFDDISAEPYSGLILDFNLVEEKIKKKCGAHGNTNDLKNLKQKQARIFNNIVAVNNFFIDRGIEESTRIGELQSRYPLWRFLSVDLVTAGTTITKLEGTGENGRQYTREDKLETMKSSLSDMYELLQGCMSKLNKNNPIHSALAGIQTTLEQWNKINDSIKPINGLIDDRLDNINYNIGEIRGKKSLKKSDVENLTNRMTRTKEMLETLSKNDIGQELTETQTKINDLNEERQQQVPKKRMIEIIAAIRDLNIKKGILEEAKALKILADKDQELKDILDKLKNQLGQYITTLSDINGVIEGAAVDNFLKSFDMLEKIKGELQAKTNPSNDQLLKLYFGAFKDKLVSYCKVFKDMKLKGTLHGVLQSVEPKLIEMFTKENKPINYDVLRSNENLYYSKAKSYFFNQINKLKLNMSAIRKRLLGILSSVNKNNKDEVDKYNEIVRRFVQFNAGTDDTGDMEMLRRSNFEFADEKGDVGSSLSVEQRNELGIINMIKGDKEYTPDFMLKNLHFLVEYCSEINGADDAKYDKLKKLGIQNLAFKSVESGKSKVILESYFNEKKLFDNRSYAQLVFNTFRDIKSEQLENLDLRLGKEDLQMSNGAIAQNFYLLLEKVYSKTQDNQDNQDKKSIAEALSGLSIDDMKTLAFLLGDWIAGNSDFYRKHGFNEICDIIKDRIMFGCQGQMIDSALKPKLNFTDQQINALVAHTFLISKKFSDRLDEIDKINSKDIYKEILPMLLERDGDEKFTLEDLSKIQSYSVKTDYVYRRISDDVYDGKAIDHEQGHDAILDCFSQPLSDVMEYLLDNMDPKPSLADLLEKVHGECLKKELPDGMWWQSIPKKFIQSELKNMFQVSKKGGKDEKKDEISDRIRTLKRGGGFIELTKRYRRYKENLDFTDLEMNEIIEKFAGWYNEQISGDKLGHLRFFLDLITLPNSKDIKILSETVLNKLGEKCECFDSGDIGVICDFLKKSQNKQVIYLTCQQAANLISKGNYFVFGNKDNFFVRDYKAYTEDKSDKGLCLSYCPRFAELKQEFDGCKCLLSSGKLSLIDYIKMINWFCYRDMFHMLAMNNNGLYNNNGYEPIDVSDNFLLKYENLGKVLPQDEFSSTNCNNILDDLYKSGFELSPDFSDSLDQLLKSSSVKSKDSDVSKNLLSRLCDVYSVFKISLRGCNSLEDIRNAFDSMKKSAPLKIAIDNKRISFSESKILTMKLLAALRAKEKGINIDSIVENEKNEEVKVIKGGLTNKSFMKILQYLNGNKEDQNYFDVQNKSLPKEDLKKDFDLVVKYVVDNFNDLFPAATLESHSSDFNNVVSFLKHFEAVVPKEDVDKKINELTNKLNGHIKNRDAGKNITAQISGIDTANVQPSDIQKDPTENPAYVETKSVQEPFNNDNDKTAGDTKIDSTINNSVNSTTDINIKNKTKITETNVIEMNSTSPQSAGVQNTTENPAYIKADNLMNDQNKNKNKNVIATTQLETGITGTGSTSPQSTDVQDTAKTNEKTGMSYAIPVILTIISPILWLISACSGFLLLWMIASGIATAVALVSWIIVIRVNLFADSPKDKLLHMLNEESDGQSMDFVKDVSRKNENVVGGPAQSCPDDKNKGKGAGPVQ